MRTDRQTNRATFLALRMDANVPKKGRCGQSCPVSHLSIVTVNIKVSNTFVKTYPYLVQYPDASSVAEVMGVCEVVTFTRRCSGIFLLLDVLFVIYVMVVVVMVLECYEWKSGCSCCAYDHRYDSEEYHCQTSHTHCHSPSLINVFTC
jgi:hypothetical protein